MKIFVMHDDHGKIGATFAATQENVGVHAMAGMKLHVFDHEPMDSVALKKFLSELHTSFRVALESGASALVKVSKSKPKGEK